ncbi:hypothetical protein ADK59_33540 [Streptomyces sp. XY332]|nr:hypothetical protein ADK59_33540 [Streptomyces sp. XY332]
MVDESDAAPLVVFANFLSDLAVELEEGRVLAQWALQAPRKAWLLRPGDVLVSPGPLTREFHEYVSAPTGVASEQAAVIEVPPAGSVPLAQAVRRAGLLGQVRAHAGRLISRRYTVGRRRPRETPKVPGEASTCVPPYAGGQQAFVDLVDRANGSPPCRSHPHWIRMTSANWSGILNESIAEDKAASDGRALSVEEILRMRDYTGVQYVIMDMIERAGGYVLPAAIRESEAMRSMRLHANREMWVTQETQSLHKEEGAGDPNLVLALERERGLSSLRRAGPSTAWSASTPTPSCDTRRPCRP